MLLAFALAMSLRLQEPDSKTHDELEPPPTDTSVRGLDGREIREPTKEKGAAPEWPTNAQRAGLNGTVKLECTVGVDGKIGDVKVVQGYQSLAGAASSAARRWRYSPLIVNGRPETFILTVTIRFQLPAPPKRRELLESLRDDDPEIRWAAVRWLGRYRPVTGDQRLALERAARDPSELVRNAAKGALAKLQAE
jgi:TonB family protein